MGVGIEWTTVIVAAIAAIPSTMTIGLAYLIRREVTTPSGEKLGVVAERTHELSIANHLILRKQNGGTDETQEA